MNVPEQVARLIETFDCNIEAYKDHEYNETQLRHEFVDPFFMALGWDVNNTEGLAEAYKDVIHEDSIRVGSATKAPDYCFRVGGTRKFFVETKRPSVNIKQDVSPAFQLRRYAWSAKLPLSILTDFEEFAVYDCRIRPVKADPASAARVKYIKYTAYADRWDEIVSVFSKDAILKGSFDKYAKSARRKRGTAEVDVAFLAEIEKWRDIIARNIALRNPLLTNRQLNFAVQRTIDRIIFLRIAEDRGIERYGELLATTSGPDTYKRLFKLFEKADDRYNSGLFHFHKEPDRDEPDDLTPTLTIDDKPLKDIMKSLYYPDSPYEFAVLPAEILGQIYEQFLGKVLTLTSGHRAKIEYKPEVKKAGGVYYTPAYIVDYIVKNTVGKLLENKTPNSASKIKILDPACGSGSFLITAYQYLLDWHLKYYAESDPSKYTKGRNPKLYQTDKGEYRLTIGERKRILLNNIFGVDIDSQAVEVTKLSLLLKVLEGEAQLVLFHKEHALPDLGNNIKCGNSLIAPDFYKNKQLTMFDEEERYRINDFDWKKEFTQIFKRKKTGFDAVIGNPPWGGDIDKELDYFHARYPLSTQEHTDSFKLFIEAALRLASTRSFVSMIVPSTLLRQRRLRDVRSLMIQKQIRAIADMGENVFVGVVAPACIFVLWNVAPKETSQLNMINATKGSNSDKSVLLYRSGLGQILSQSDFLANSDLEFMRCITPRLSSVVPFEKFNHLKCKDAGINYQRVKVGMQEKGKSDLSKRLLYEGKQENKEHEMFWKGTDISRYYIKPSTNRFCRPDYHTFVRPNEVVRLNKEVYNTVPKIIFRQTADRIIATIDSKGIWFGRSIIAILLDPQSEYSIEYFLGLLNSGYFRFLYHQISHESGRVFAQVKLSKIKQLPIRTLDFSHPEDKARHDRMVSLVQTMLKLNKQLAKAKTSHEKTALKRQIDATDRQIDNLVYKLYDLTDEEIAIVEGQDK